MAATVSPQHAQLSPTGRSTTLPYSCGGGSLVAAKSYFSTSSAGPVVTTALCDGLSSSSTTTSKRTGSRARLRAIDTTMGSHSTSAPLSGIPRSTSGRLQKRAGSGSSLPGPPSPFNNTASHPQFPTLFASYEESPPDVVVSGSTPKIKPYLRKASKEDQGRIDLSKPVAENDGLSGLGIHDFAGKIASDVTFIPAGRRATHVRTTSVGSQVSTGSGSNRANQPFVHPMRQTPRPYTPPASYPASPDDDETNESDDIIEEDFRLGHGFRSRRSMSISSMQPTPLSQSHTADDLARLELSASHTNLSDKSSASKLNKRPSRPRQDTDRSVESQLSPSSRTSFDKAFNLVSRRSDTEPVSRDERIRAARRKFEEKEASKDLKHEREAFKLAERQRRQSESSTTASRPREGSFSQVAFTATTRKKSKTSDEMTDEKLRAKSYDETRPTNKAALPRLGREAGMSEKSQVRSKASTPQGNWVRFSAWFQTRMLDCGGAR